MRNFKTYLNNSALNTGAFMAQLDNYLADYVKKTTGKNKFNKDSEHIISGYYIGANGVFAENEDYVISHLIPINIGEKLKCSFPVGGTRCMLVDESGVYISDSAINSDVIENSTASKIYALFSIPVFYLPTAQIESGEVSTEYEEYNELFGQLKTSVVTESILATDSVTRSKIKNGQINTEKMAYKAVNSDSLEIIKPVLNLFNINDPDYAEDKYIGNAEGTLTDNTSYNTTGYIPIDRVGSKIICSQNGVLTNFRRLIFLDENKISLGVLYSSTNNIEIPVGAKYARLTLFNANTIAQIEIGDEFSGYYTPYSESIEDKYISNIKPSQSKLLKSITGHETFKFTQALLLAGNTITETTLPKYIKKNVQVSFYCDITDIPTIIFGKGFQTYTGRWVEINDTNIIHKKYATSETIEDTIPHGLTLKTFIKCILDVSDTGVCTVILSTLEGYFKTEITGWTYFSGDLFLTANNYDISNITISYGCSDFKKPVWMFGDSYFSLEGNNRALYYLRDWGYFNVLICALSGGTSEVMLEDLNRCMQFGVPSHIVWCLGMNDTDADYLENLQNIINICYQYNIELTLATIPTVPTRNKEVVTQAVRDSGYRYIDQYKAVGANSLGEWYTGYLFSDGVHPDVLGAKALATQFLTDCPKIMQYGKI